MTEPLFDDGFRALLFEMPFRALDLLGQYRAHMVTDVADSNRLKEGDDRFVLQP
jgi:hypothetical protein